jgi:hypothetical protein
LRSRRLLAAEAAAFHDRLERAPPSSTLAAEVAQLDAARTALDVGSFCEAKRLIAPFHREFPRGTVAAKGEPAWSRKGSAGSRLCLLCW